MRFLLIIASWFGFAMAFGYIIGTLLRKLGKYDG